ncbi:sensor histidine kinase [Bosea sp. (in: a-proteobacteria)]|uniref:sensor histidine kinase n=1 Tax=Bosea sp. (in: a-proteobacteria) TaxID=1871050 RepID=UPI002B482711|nr:histidine kinase dimerization/phosphoacceptor domain -containing protein [Bosea sp. (in: a-proteobacteria)]WRH60091.1 MAG: histidine kinase dimerization/phosphoacceptor domain -containing protein [Bosea sp. (in: a-proteobacteria)]
MADKTDASATEIALGLALAVISSSDAPLLLLNERLEIIVASRSFCRVFSLNPANVVGQKMADLGAGEWDVPQLDSLLKATASGFAEVEAYEMNLQRVDRSPQRLVINAHKLDYQVEEDVRVLLSVLDVTEARRSERQKDELLREKAILLQELQHRVANSLQIIASVLMQSARKVQSTETRGHLQDAHHRVMSVAALQQQLATSQIGDVKLKPYLMNLCGSIAASMIPDRDALTLDVEVDDSIVPADRSISLGLVVTELVINALKHAYPGQRGGRITVGYKATGADWSLIVADDGVGMPTAAEDAKAGLGTSIVKALAGQLGAEIAVTEAQPGTIVTLIHVADVDSRGQPMPDPVNEPV